MSQKEKVTVEQLAQELSSVVEVYKASAGGYFIQINDEDFSSGIVAIESDDFANCLRQFAYQSYGKILSPMEVDVMQKHFTMLAWNRKRKIELFHRTIYRNKAVYYDLDEKNTIKITADQCRIVHLKKPLFIRNNMFAPQVMPDMEVEAHDVVAYVKKHFHLKSETDCILLCVFLITCFWGRAISHPLLQVYGEKGSAKTTTLRQIQDLIDCKEADLMTLPKKEDDVAVCLYSQYMTCFDNISYITAGTSDLLCRNCTGGTYNKRKLFSNFEQAIVQLKSVVCLNGTCQNIVRSDLADRTIFLELQRITDRERKTDRQLKSAWKADRPKFFGALLKAVQGVLADKETQTGKSSIRLADFFELAVKAGVQIGFSKERVIDALNENRERMANAVLEANIVITAIMAFMKEEQEWSGNITDFYLSIKEYAMSNLGISFNDFPKSSNSFSRELNKNKSDLEQLGIVFKTSRGNSRNISLRLIPTVSTQSQNIGKA